MNRRLFLSALAATAASGHDLYFMPDEFRAEEPGRKRIRFHLGDSFPDSEVAQSVSGLVDPQARWKGGAAPIENLSADGDVLVGDAELPALGAYILTVSTRAKTIEIAAERFDRYLTHEGLNAQVEYRRVHGESARAGRERYSKCVTSFLSVGDPDDYWKTAVGFPIEIVPEASPFEVRPGGGLPIRVLFRGRPAAELQVEAAWAHGGRHGAAPAGRTDAEGRLTVPIEQAGVWRLHTVHMLRVGEPEIEWESYWASATLAVGGGR